MAEIALKVVDPGGYRFAQLVDDQEQVRRLLPLFVDRLGLPRELNYYLVPSATGRALPADISFRQAGVKPGAELVIRVARDPLLQMLVAKLYKEAKRFMTDEVWDLARQRLRDLYRLDPNYGDPAHLRSAIPGGVGPPPVLDVPLSDEPVSAIVVPAEIDVPGSESPPVVERAPPLRIPPRPPT